MSNITVIMRCPNFRAFVCTNIVDSIMDSICVLVIEMLRVSSVRIKKFCKQNGATVKGL